MVTKATMVMVMAKMWVMATATKLVCDKEGKGKSSKGNSDSNVGRD